MSFSPDGRWLVVGARLWEITSDTVGEVIILPVNVQRVDAVTFSPDSNWLVTGGNAGTSTSADLWNLRTLLLAAEPTPIILHHPDDKNSQYDKERNLYRERSQVRAAAFSPDGHWLATAMGSHPHSILIWPIRLQDRINRACQLVDPTLKNDQRYKDACPETN